MVEPSFSALLPRSKIFLSGSLIQLSSKLVPLIVTFLTLSLYQINYCTMAVSIRSSSIYQLCLTDVSSTSFFPSYSSVIGFLKLNTSNKIFHYFSLYIKPGLQSPEYWPRPCSSVPQQTSRRLSVHSTASVMPYLCCDVGSWMKGGIHCFKSGIAGSETKGGVGSD
jgi:hypothetical protein